MKTAFRESFARDLKGVRDKKLLRRVKECIEAVENTDSLGALPNLKKLRGAKSYFRLKLGDHRIGLAVENNTIVFGPLPRSKRYLQILPVRPDFDFDALVTKKSGSQSTLSRQTKSTSR